MSSLDEVGGCIRDRIRWRLQEVELIVVSVKLLAVRYTG